MRLPDMIAVNLTKDEAAVVLSALTTFRGIAKSGICLLSVGDKEIEPLMAVINTASAVIEKLRP